LRIQRALGVPVERLSLEEARALLPFRDEGLAWATFGPIDGVIDPHGATAFYLRRARPLGAEVRYAEPLLEAQRRRGVWWVRTSRTSLEAPYLLLATGAWTGEVGWRLGLDLPIWPVRRMVFATAALGLAHPFPLTVDLATGFYLRPEGPRVFFGRANSREAPGFREGLDWSWLYPTLETGLARFPLLEGAALDPDANSIWTSGGAGHCLGRWVGPYAGSNFSSLSNRENFN